MMCELLAGNVQFSAYYESDNIVALHCDNTVLSGSMWNSEAESAIRDDLLVQMQREAHKLQSLMVIRKRIENILNHYYKEI